VPRPPAWRHTLDEARRQALVAVDFYNRPGDRRSFTDFIVHIHLAWQNLMLPKAAAAAVEARIPFRFGVNNFTKLRQMWQIGPEKGGDMRAMTGSDGFAVYSPAFGQFVYTPKLVDRMVDALSTGEAFARYERRETMWAANTALLDEVRDTDERKMARADA
jgi:hypothetical protein